MNNLARLREKKNLTQEELANALGVSSSTIAMYEIGERMPRLKFAKKIADFFEVPIEHIFFNINAHDSGARRAVSK